LKLDFVHSQVQAIANVAASMCLLSVSKGTESFVKKSSKVKTSAFNEGFQTLKLQTACSRGFTIVVKGIQSCE